MQKINKKGHFDYNISSYYYSVGSLVVACVHNFFVWQPGQKWCQLNLSFHCDIMTSKSIGFKHNYTMLTKFEIIFD